MTDPDLVAKKVAFIETCVTDLRRLARPERMEDDLREQRFVIYTLQIAVQAVLDVASHVVSDERLGEPETNRALFEILERGGRLSPYLASRLAEMTGFRNVVVHGDAGVDLAIVRDVVEHRLDDLLEFVAVARAWG